MWLDDDVIGRHAVIINKRLFIPIASQYGV
jgi:hypothetical protein